MTKISRSAMLLMILAFFCSGCAIVDKRNRRTLNLLDSHVRIESTGGRVAAAPVFIPVGLAAALTDMLIVHPIVSVPPAIKDTRECIWENPEGSEFRQMMLFIPKVAFTPVFFAGDLVFRVLLPIPPD